MADINVGESKTFSYTGAVQQITLLPGRYKLEAYGASGGSGYGAGLHTRGSIGGLGGYTSGEIILEQETTLFIYVGGKGVYGSGNNGFGGPVGGWNGGGRGGNSSSGSGGGATDFRLQGGTWNNVESLKSRILVAGGAGGADNPTGEGAGGSDDGSGGSGGGLIAQGCWISGGYNSGYAGTQTGGGAFGYGVAVTTNTDTGGAGGGWYGGKPSNNYNGGGGGGSSYLAGYPGCNTSYLESHQNNLKFENGILNIGKNNGNGYAIVTYIHGLKKYTITTDSELLVCDKTEAYQTETVTVVCNKDSSCRLKQWLITPQIEYTVTNKTVIVFNMPASNVVVSVWTEPNRLNTNIYKNIFPEVVMNMDYINKLIDKTPTSINDIIQENHELELYDVVYLDTDGKYKKAIAENSKRGFPVGVVAGVPSPHVFTLITTGLVQYDKVYTYDDTSILYLSDKDPGKLVHYEEIDNTIYIPVAVYTNQGIVVNILQGSIGGKMLPYEQTVQTFEPYSLYEINQLIVQVKEGVIDDG